MIFLTMTQVNTSFVCCTEKSLTIHTAGFGYNTIEEFSFSQVYIFRYSYKKGGNESLWKRFIGVVSDETWRIGEKAWVN